MNENIDRFKIWCRNHILLLIVILFVAILVFMLIGFVIFMHNKIVFGFPEKNSENIAEYYGALSQLYGGIIGGIIGGLFTVIGVSITVYVANCDRKKDLIMADKPKLMTGGNINTCNSYRITPKLDYLYENDIRKVYTRDELLEIDKEMCFANYKPFSIYVTNNADCILEGIILGDKMIYSFENQYVLIKGNTYAFDLTNYYFMNDGNVYDNITLICSSLAERRYYFTCSNEDEKEVIDNHNVLIISVLSLDERIHGYDKKVELLERKLDDESTKHINELIKEKRIKDNGSDLDVQ